MDTGVGPEIVVAIGVNYVIGKNGDLPWRGKFPADMARFRELTSGHSVIMGRKTWESLPTKFRPLPHRHNIVVSRQRTYRAQGALICSSLDEAMKLCVPHQRAFVIGGAELYRLALPMTTMIHLTIIHHNFEGDSTFPKLDLTKDWHEVQRKDFEADTKNHFRYSFMTLLRRIHEHR
jgi:dihydrofolate reductase